ncbi:MAG: DNA replication/repair protein RecF [bacterium]
MILDSLTVSQFRCWTYREFQFGSDITYIEGPNATGKTSILEAINYLSKGRSMRATRDSTCVQWNKDSFSLRAEFLPDGVENASPSSLSVSYGSTPDTNHDRRRVIKLNGDVVEKLSDLHRKFPTILFTPDDLSILKGGPAKRRDFLNELLSYLDDNYLDWLKEYQKIRQQRNSLLKTPSPDHVLLDQYDSRLVELGEQIVQVRSELMPELEAEVQSKTRKLLDEDGIESMSLNYEADVEPSDSFETVLDASRSNDLEKGYTTRGPQRDDWMIQIKNRPVDRFASQGQLRSLLLTLKLAANSVIINRVSRVPLLLLDDVESELDEKRQKRVLDLLGECASQVIITGIGHLDVSANGESETLLSLEAR